MRYKEILSEYIHDQLPLHFVMEEHNVKWAIDPNINKARRWSQHDQQNLENTIIWVDIRKLLAATNLDQQLDLDDPIGGKNSIKGRVKKAIDHFIQNQYMDPPLVSLGFRGIDFTDGRHRLVAAYNLGEKTAPIIVPKDQVKEISELLK